MSAADRKRAIHPFLFALFPIASLLSSYADQVPAAEALLPAGIALLAVGVLWLFSRLFLCDAGKRGLALSLFIAAFYAYGPIADKTRALFGQRYLLGDVPLFPLFVVGVFLAGAIVYWLRNTPRDFARLTAFLNITSVLALMIPAGLVAMEKIPEMRGATRQASVAPIETLSASERPDIYYIILDGYTRQDVLRDFFHYDNSRFISALEKKGFYVAADSHSNYNLTYLSLCSSLNLDYLDTLASQGDPKQTFRSLAEEQLRDSKAAAFLKARGYRLISFATPYTSTNSIHADFRERPKTFLTEYQNVLINLTPLRTILDRMENPWQYLVYRNMMSFTLDRLPRVDTYPGPRFVVAHVVAPHPPFVVDANGRSIYPSRPYRLTDGWEFYEDGGSAAEYLEGYTGQVAYLNQRVLRIVEEIRRKNPNAIIILQGDHGSRLSNPVNLREAFAILNAYYLPGRDARSILYPGISPVNTFRLIFDAYFETKSGRLPDSSYSYDSAEPRRFRDVTGQVIPNKAVDAGKSVAGEGT